MSSLIDDARSLLEGSGFATFVATPDARSLTFEDISVLGQVHALDSADDILANWQHLQDTFLRENAERLSRDASKAWNVYTVLLTRDSPNGEAAARLFAIEDDFRGTRKIARCGVLSRPDVTAALAPILPLQNVLSVGVIDAKDRLAERLRTISPALESLVGDASVESVVAMLVGNE
jgi:hypothetical protein